MYRSIYFMNTDKHLSSRKFDIACDNELRDYTNGDCEFPELDAEKKIQRDFITHTYIPFLLILRIRVCCTRVSRSNLRIISGIRIKLHSQSQCFSGFFLFYITENVDE